MARIIVVDDEPGWLDLCKRHLQDYGHKVLAVRNWMRALQMVWFHQPDLVILDIRMPRSGSSLLHILKQHWPELPVIMHSVYSHYKEDPTFDQADSFVVKTVDCTELVDKVRSVLQLFSEAREDFERAAL
jgi:DNA-binding NtrC family response regulator